MLICTNAILIKDPVWSKVHIILKVWISEHFMDDQPWVAIEDLVDVRHPLWSRCIVVATVYVSILDRETLPRNPSDRMLIDCRIEFIMVRKRYLPTDTYLKETVDVPLRHLNTAI